MSYNSVGELLFECLKRNPEHIFQIDAATGEEETQGSVFRRSVQMAKCLLNYGLKPGDVVVLSGRTHLDIRIPLYAAFMNGQAVAIMDPTNKYDETLKYLTTVRPNIMFCDEEIYNIAKIAAEKLKLETKVVKFGDGDDNMKKFMEDYISELDEDFKPAQFDTEKTFAMLISTSGTTSLPKIAAIRHEAVLQSIEESAQGYKSFFKNSKYFQTGTLHWISAFIYSTMIPYVGGSIIQTSGDINKDTCIDIINKYKPHLLMCNPTLLSDVIKSNRDCDMNSFKLILVSSGRVSHNLLLKLRERTKGIVTEAYGQTEVMGASLVPSPESPPGSSGKQIPGVQYRLLNIETDEDISEPFKTGELLIKKEVRFTEYYNNPEETKKAFFDGFVRSGDLFYFDEQGNYFFVDRIKSLIKYRGHHIAPVEIENVIRTHPAVQDVVVVAVDDDEEYEVPLACVVVKAGAKVTAVEIENLVAENLSVWKRLRGGVMFLDELPLTSNGKVAQGKIKQMAADFKRKLTV